MSSIEDLDKNKLRFKASSEDLVHIYTITFKGGLSQGLASVDLSFPTCVSNTKVFIIHNNMGQVFVRPVERNSTLSVITLRQPMFFKERFEVRAKQLDQSNPCGRLGTR